MAVKSQEFRAAHKALREISIGERLWLSMYTAAATPGVDSYVIAISMLNALAVMAAQQSELERFKIAEHLRDLADILEKGVLEHAK